MNPSLSRKAYVYLVNHVALIRDVTVTYANKTVDSGFVHHAGADSMGKDLIILCRHEVARNEDPEVVLDFSKARTIEVELQDGTVEVFE